MSSRTTWQPQRCHLKFQQSLRPNPSIKLASLLVSKMTTLADRSSKWRLMNARWETRLIWRRLKYWPSLDKTQQHSNSSWTQPTKMTSITRCSSRRKPDRSAADCERRSVPAWYFLINPINSLLPLHSSNLRSSGTSHRQSSHRPFSWRLRARSRLIQAGMWRAIQPSVGWSLLTQIMKARSYPCKLPQQPQILLTVTVTTIPTTSGFYHLLILKWSLRLNSARVKISAVTETVLETPVSY